ncbi:helix-turn-helix domain-containing protein [Candidatus Woesebacteria bacterium]|nr:helix-turn-helix domain-containing protein [Candidatus Woesebacteria bacterium]
MRKTAYYLKAKRLETLPKEELLNLYFDLINAFRMVRTPLETINLVQDLLTATEIKNLAKRLRIAKLLLTDKTQREIAKEVHVSIATVTKVSIWLEQKGEGLKSVISKLPDRYKLPKNLPPIPIEFHLPQALLTLAQYGLYKRQTNRLERFSENIEGKKALDEELREMFDEEFRTRKKKRKIS